MRILFQKIKWIEKRKFNENLILENVEALSDATIAEKEQIKADSIQFGLYVPANYNEEQKENKQ